MKKYILLVVLTLMVSACGPQARFNRLTKNHPELITKMVDTFTTINIDTFVDKDTLYTKEYKDIFIIRHDTIIKQGKVTIQKKGVMYEVKVDADTIIYHDTIIREIPVKGKVITVKESTFPTTGIILILLLLTLLFWLTKNKK